MNIKKHTDDDKLWIAINASGCIGRGCYINFEHAETISFASVDDAIRMAKGILDCAKAAGEGKLAGRW